VKLAITLIVNPANVTLSRIQWQSGLKIVIIFSQMSTLSFLFFHMRTFAWLTWCFVWDVKHYYTVLSVWSL